MRLKHIVNELILSPFFHLFSSVVLALLGLKVEAHPRVATYLLYLFALLSLSLSVWNWRFRRHQKLKDKRLKEEERQRLLAFEEQERQRLLAEGQYYPKGELEALPHIKADLDRLHRGAVVTICGTGVTAIVYIAAEVYEALKRGVDFEVFILHPRDSLVDRLADMEPDLQSLVVDPMVEKLKGEEELRKLLAPEWCDKAAEIFDGTGNVCPLHPEGHITCALHGRVICTSGDIWRRVSQQVINLNRPRDVQSYGSLRIFGYQTIPSVKAWRFMAGPSETSSVWYYVADHLYHRGVGVDNPMRRFDRGPEGPAFVNIKRIDAYLERVRTLSEELLIVTGKPA